MKKRSIGIFNGAVAAASYGTNPLFALPLYAAGIGVNSVLFYRYAFAVNQGGTSLSADTYQLRRYSISEIYKILTVES